MKLSAYLDDYILIAKTATMATHQVQLQLRKLAELGLMVNLKKSSLVPSRTTPHLGFTIDSQQMTLSVPTSKIRDLRRKASRLLHRPSMPLRTLASFVDKALATSLAVQPPGSTHGTYFKRRNARCT